MRSRTRGLFLAALTVTLAFALLPGRPARAEDPAVQPGVWIYDLRVVRVEPVEAAGAEAALPFGTNSGATTDLPWKDALALLKQRGRTTLLLDQRVTTLTGVKANASSERVRPVLLVNMKTKNDEQRRASTIRSGCKLEVTPGDDAMRYVVDVRWTAPAASPDGAPQQLSAAWQGSHPPLRGRTLVLHQGEQVRVRNAGQARAVEIYALLTGRLLQKR